MNKFKGFTIIELVVVIAIIAILATIVLIAVTGYVNRSKDATAQADMAALLTNAVTYAQDNGGLYTKFALSATYGTGQTACNATGTDSSFTDVCTALTGKNMGYLITVSKSSDATAWCACVPFMATSGANQYNVFCVDSRGTKRATTTGVSGGTSGSFTCANICSAGACDRDR